MCTDTILCVEPIQHASIFLSGSSEEGILELPERTGRDEAIGPGLVGLPDTLHVEELGELVQAAVQAVAELHEVLDVVDGGEVNLHEPEEAGLRVGEGVAGEDLEQVPEVVAGVEGDPADGVAEHDPGGHEQLGEAARVDAALGVAAEVDAAVAEQLDGVGGVDVARVVELAEVELPDAAAAGRCEGPGPRDGSSPVGEEKVRPSWMRWSMSTLALRVA
jgi:hypothetical protein